MAGSMMNARAEIDRLTPGLRRFARALLIDAHDSRLEAGDAIVQEAVLHVLRSERQPEAPIARAALYRALIEGAVVRGKAAGGPAGGRRAAQAADGDAQAPAQPQSGRREAIGISSALEALSLDDRAALLLVTLEDFSYAEAAEALNVPRMVLVQRLVRARAIVSTMFEDGAHGGHAGHPHLRLVT
jgi:RNA polymerase sigma-70 factor (ECF subfamily)